MAMVVHPLGIQDWDGAESILAIIGGCFPRLKKILTEVMTMEESPTGPTAEPQARPPTRQDIPHGRFRPGAKAVGPAWLGLVAPSRLQR